MARRGCRRASPRALDHRQRSRLAAVWPSRRAIARDHVEAMLEHGGVHGLRGARKHIGWYLARAAALAGRRAVKAWRRRLCTNENAREVLDGLAAFYARATVAEMPAGEWPHERRRGCPRPHRSPSAPRRHIEYDLLLAALPHPILVLGDDDRVLYANAAAESFFSLSQGMLKRQTLPDIIAFSSPLAALVAPGAAHRRHRQRIRRRRRPAAQRRQPRGRRVRRRAARQPRPDRADAAAALDGADDRAPAHAPRRRALGVRHGAGAGARDQEPAVRHPRRRPAARARPQGRGPRADPADLHRDRPHPQSGRPHGGVRRRAPAQHRAGQHPLRARPREAAGRDPALPRTSRSTSSSIPRCRRWPATATS